MTGRARRVEGDTPVHTAVIDWDGTAVPAVWPEHANEFMPGFVESMRTLHRAGVRLIISSARISPWDPYTGERRDAAYVAAEVQHIRHMLDEAGLTFVDIWTREGKPGGSVYVDDKAERYTGRKKSWDKLTEKILLRLSRQEAFFPALPGGTN